MKHQERIQQREKELEELRAAVESHKVSLCRRTAANRQKSRS